MLTLAILLYRLKYSSYSSTLNGHESTTRNQIQQVMWTDVQMPRDLGRQVSIYSIL